VAEDLARMTAEAPVEWLLAGGALERHRTLIDLLGLDEEEEEAVLSRKRMLQDARIQNVLRKRNKDGYWGTPDDIFKWWPRKDTTFWVLGMLADFGFSKDDCGLERACEYVIGTQMEDGAFGLRAPDKAYDCFTGVLAGTLARLGYCDDRRLMRAYGWLAGRQRLDGGFWCKDTGQPGGSRQDEPSCALATLYVLGALVAHPEHRDGGIARRSASFLLDCWDNRGLVKYAGHDSQVGKGWDKLKYPFTDYRILAYLDTLSQLPNVRNDPRLTEVVEQLAQKRDADGRSNPESIHRVWAAFDYGQKKQPSRWLTLIVYRILQRFCR